MYHVGQVVKCRVTSSIPASRRINLSFIIKPTRFAFLIFNVVNWWAMPSLLCYEIYCLFTRGKCTCENNENFILENNFEFNAFVLMVPIIGVPAVMLFSICNREYWLFIVFMEPIVPSNWVMLHGWYVLSNQKLHSRFLVTLSRPYHYSLPLFLSIWSLLSGIK